MNIALQADPANPHGLDISDSLIQTSVEHVAQEYGYYVATAERAGNETVYDARTDASPPEVQTDEVNPETREVSPRSLERAVRDVEREADQGADEA